MIGEQFEKILLKQVKLADVEIQGDYQTQSSPKPIDSSQFHRYSPETAASAHCQLSTSIGVLITAYNTPIYYANRLVEQLLKSAKKRAKQLRELGYCGGTVDFLVMKGVTMISSNIEVFRNQALTKDRGQKLKLYAAPYTFHELAGLLAAAQALKESEFPKSQIYQIRSLLERGKQTAILNYRYFRVRLKREQQVLLKEKLEEAWCAAKTNSGNIAPWMFDRKEKVYETIWQELVDIYPFIEMKQGELVSIKE